MTQNNNQRRAVKPFEELTYTDNFLFGEVMQDEFTSKNVLEIILDIKIRKVVVLEKEKHIDNIPDRKSIRLDIYLEDDEHTIYNIEMQVDDRHDIPKRSRYYQGLMDTKSLPTGAISYNSLNKSFVIFICLFDPFGYDRCFYSFEERCVEDPSLSLGDETRKIFLNATGQNREGIREELQEFLDYIKNPSLTIIKSTKVQELDNRVNKVKSNEKVRSKYMTLTNWILEERDIARTEGRAEGEKEGELKILISLVKDGILSLDYAAQKANLTTEQFSEVMNQNGCKEE